MCALRVLTHYVTDKDNAIIPQFPFPAQQMHKEQNLAMTQIIPNFVYVPLVCGLHVCAHYVKWQT